MNIQIDSNQETTNAPYRMLCTKSVPIISFLYIVNVVLNVVGLKAVSYYYNITHPLVSCVLYGQLFPIACCYQLYHHTPIRFIHVCIGIVDYVQLLFMSISVSQLSVATYLGLRNTSTIANVILAYLFLEKKYTTTEYLGVGIISTSCILLFYLGGMDQFSSSILIFIFSILYSIIGLLMEMNKEIPLVLESKVVSSFLQVSTFFYYSLGTNDLYQAIHYSWGLGTIMLFIASSEYLYYFLKERLMSLVQQGSILVTILDMIRRIITLGVGMLCFQEHVDSYVYYCFGVMMIGSFLYYFHSIVSI